MSRIIMVAAAVALSLPISMVAAQEQALHANAALKYWQAFALMPQLDQQEARHFGGTPGGEYPPNYFGAPLNDIAVGLIRRSDTALDLLHGGAKHTDCDWGVDLDDGPNALLPHTSKARHLAGLACLRARRHLERGQYDSGVDDVVAVLRLARHVGSDRTLAGLYVQWTTEKQAMQIAAAFLPKLPPATLQRLAAKLNALPPGGSLKGTLKVEQDYLLGWYIKQLRSQQAAASIEEIFGPDVQTLAVAKAASADADELAEMLEALQPYFEKLIEVTELPPQARANRLDAIQQNSQQASPLAQLFIPGYRITFENEPQARTRMAMFKAAVDIVLGGPGRVTAHTDPFGEAFEHRVLGTGPAFELSSTLTVKSGRIAMRFGEASFSW